jgi:hypothetical protein
MFQGVPLIIGIGIVAASVLHFSFGLPLSTFAGPIAVLLAVQVMFYVGMYAVRKRCRKTQDLRVGAAVRRSHPPTTPAPSKGRPLTDGGLLHSGVSERAECYGVSAASCPGVTER